jgi:hypothetical protein
MIGGRKGHPGAVPAVRTKSNNKVLVSNNKVLVIAATNSPWSVDDAFKRPGRFISRERRESGVAEEVFVVIVISWPRSDRWSPP